MIGLQSARWRRLTAQEATPVNLSLKLDVADGAAEGRKSLSDVKTWTSSEGTKKKDKRGGRSCGCISMARILRTDQRETEQARQ
jgi:hypothetical protein